MKTLKTIMYFVFALQLASPTGHAQEEIINPLEVLVESTYRPTPLDILRAFDGQLPNKNPFMSEEEMYKGNLDNGAGQLKNIRQTVESSLPAMAASIAILEKTYPNALYFPMGRDAAFYADGLDFFYLTIGEPNRVHRLRASGPTVRALTSKTGIDFLKSNHFGEEPRRPHILIDNTGFSNYSQSRILFNFATKILTEAGVPEAEHYKYLAVGAAQGWSPEKSVKKNEDIKQSSFATSTLNLGLNGLFYNGGFWHRSSTGRLRAMESGELAGVYGKPFNRATRRFVLAYIYETMKAVNSPSFLALVNKELDNLGIKDRFASKKRKKLTYVPLTDEMREFFSENNIDSGDAEVRFRKSLSATIDRRLHPSVRAGYASIYAKAIPSINLLTPEEYSYLKSTYFARAESIKLATAQIGVVDIKLIEDEIEKIIPAPADLFEKLDALMARLPEVDSTQASKGWSPQGITLQRWMSRYYYTTQKGDFKGPYLTLIAAYKANKILRDDLIVLLDLVFQYESYSFGNEAYKESFIADKKLHAELDVLYKMNPKGSANRSLQEYFEYIKTQGFIKVSKKSCKDILKAS